MTAFDFERINKRNIFHYDKIKFLPKTDKCDTTLYIAFSIYQYRR